MTHLHATIVVILLPALATQSLNRSLANLWLALILKLFKIIKVDLDLDWLLALIEHSFLYT